MPIIDPKNISFLASNIRAALGKNLAKNDGLTELLGLIADDWEWQDIRHVAYLLGTVALETAYTFRPIVERGGPKYFQKYDAGTKLGKRLGNDLVGDGFKYRGRGYCQCTGKNNYEVFTKELSVDLVCDPDKALQPEISYKITSIGMRRGLFTGKALHHYIDGEKCDYLNARRIINSMDRAEDIATYARMIESVITPKEVECTGS